ncbi:hypothetical protein CANARDRAFT_24865 [[Candida] arabinofermentans NRRL YB-2248]|uniref:Uncharacterized protein n=1 Tax=[Candida] arabinofermentans NRRL YB-2248 TaxID=983967 RepID=A0A1E4SVV2_9ASCO|nr:hypothetical protein CANARDRAFT_24865 [[Candida] arabinofermentans NRRL YB-2248]
MLNKFTLLSIVSLLVLNKAAAKLTEEDELLALAYDINYNADMWNDWFESDEGESYYEEYLAVQSSSGEAQTSFYLDLYSASPWTSRLDEEASFIHTNTDASGVIQSTEEFQEIATTDRSSYYGYMATSNTADDFASSIETEVAQVTDSSSSSDDVTESSANSATPTSTVKKTKSTDSTLETSTTSSKADSTTSDATSTKAESSSSAGGFALSVQTGALVGSVALFFGLLI